MPSRNEQVRYAYTSRIPPPPPVPGDAPAKPLHQIKDMNGEPIRRGDQVFSRVRGGRQEGMVEMIITGDEDADADEDGVPDPPKVLYVDRQGHAMAHDPEALRHVGQESGVSGEPQAPGVSQGLEEDGRQAAAAEDASLTATSAQALGPR